MSFNLESISTAYETSRASQQADLDAKCTTIWDNISTQLSNDLTSRANQGYLYKDYNNTDSIYEDLSTMISNPNFISDLPISISNVYMSNTKDYPKTIRVSVNISTTTTTSTTITEEQK